MSRWFYRFMVMLTVLAISSPSFWGVWVFMELLTLVFSSFLAKSDNKLLKSKSFLYFITQAVSSSLFLLGCLMFFVNISPLIIVISMLIKLGMFPFHTWVLNFVECISWPYLSMFFGLLKGLPLLILSFYSSDLNVKFIWLFVLGSWASLGGLTSSSVRVILAFSSIGHMGWMAVLSSWSFSLLMTYYLSYWLMVSSFCKINKLNKTYSLSDISVMKPSCKAMFLVIVMSMMGFPPFLGFFPKIFCLQLMAQQTNLLYSLILLGCSSVTSYFYLKMIIIKMSINKHSNNSFNFFDPSLTSVLGSMSVVSYFSVWMILFL